MVAARFLLCLPAPPKAIPKNVCTCGPRHLRQTSPCRHQHIVFVYDRSVWHVRCLLRSRAVRTHACSAGAPARTGFFLRGRCLFSCACCFLLACAGLLRVDCKFPSAAFVLSCSRRWCVLQCGKLKNLSMHGGCGLRPSHSCSPVRINIDDEVMQPTLVQCAGHKKP